MLFVASQDLSLAPKNLKPATTNWTLFPRCFQTLMVFGSKNWVGEGFPGSPVGKNPPANSGDTGSIPNLRRPHVPQSS